MEIKPPEALPLKECGLLITGGTAGVGLATAFKFAEAGVTRIALVGRAAERGERARVAVQERFPAARVVFIQADAMDPAQATRAVETAERQIGNVDILVNSVSSAAVPGLFHESPIEDVLPTVVNQLLPPLHMCRAAVAGMASRRRGAIVNISSDAAKVSTPGEAVVGSAMAAIVRFSTAFALEAKRYGVRVNVVTPSLIGGTDAYDKLMKDEFAGKLFEKALRAAHLGMTLPEDLAPLIVFLASPEAARITGQVISVNGGISVA
ncbi:SDR family oxidoreductase [Azoarcus sp. DN11]|uniref:SDR family NAD(P)-dependent oxidoreductase n=1 Tax=Azoarcus sp. DN11 TaxID=356837 RepID=UPI000EB2FD98|nr:SDR family oxidoreductase [Azoarcus sp. DN11]AYH43568.1 oxidoreductase [Azoarcus sp. DN11]